MLASPLAIDPWLLLTIGLGAGILSGLLGVGGGIVVTPALNLLGLPIHTAVGTTLTQMVISSLSGTLRHHKQGNVSFPLAFSFVIPCLVGVYLGKNMLVGAASQPELLEKFTLGYGVFLIAMAALMARRYLKSSEPSSVSWPSLHWGPKLRLKHLECDIPVILVSSFGLVTGVLSALTGLGGGFFYLPMMVFVLNIPLKIAIGSSLAIVVATSTSGAIAYGIEGYTVIPVAVILACGSFTGAFLGASATSYLNSDKLKIMFAALVLMAGISVIVKQFGLHQLSLYLLFSSGGLLLFGAMVIAFRNFLLAKQVG